MVFAVRFVKILARLSFLSQFRAVLSRAALAILVLTAGATAQNVTLSATTLTFGNVAVGTTSATKNVTLTNTGTAMLSISGITVTGPFAETNTCGSTMPVLFQSPAGSWPNLVNNANLVPVVANGKVFVASYRQLQIFGLLPPKNKARKK